LFLCLPTPPDEDGSADVQHVLGAARSIGKILAERSITDFKIIVTKSTVPVGTSEKVRMALLDTAPHAHCDVVSNPEFLREGFAVEDFMKPDRIVIGTTNPQSAALMRDLYEPFTRSGNPIYILDVKSAELAKYAANAFLAMRISFMNELSAYCEAVGADIEAVRLAIGSDSRIGKRFLFAGIGYGGSCFPKDVRALKISAEHVGVQLGLVAATEEANARQIHRFVERIIARLGRDLTGKRIAVWGIAFKPNTDDTREAPSFKVIDHLLAAGATVVAYDPEALAGARRYYGDRFGERLIYGTGMYESAEHTDALVIVTEWSEFRKPDMKRLVESMRTPLIFDGRNLFDTRKMAEAGFEYHSIGRSSVAPLASLQDTASIISRA
ncbi:MAG: UDP-glucose/GDP-mannose dehydrogenase family protein, partial [Bacteroidota bacterium]|nr:UDP-glucose/GDP-mannose dehydrogenase family protein [Candidatus Kapabacteria bacterium]MDW8219594.1 UDP-glucose/GDP-mannose dehydrogenase family protein [Bacteroidota bacterium]